MKTVLIVGAGPSGLAGAKILLSTKKFDLKVYEKADRIGGIWALDEESTDGFLHPDTPTNLSRFTVGFSDLDWNTVDLTSSRQNAVSNANATKRPAPMFPKAWQVNRYLETYRSKYVPDGVIHFGREVVKTDRVEGAEGTSATWKVTSKGKDSAKRVEDFDYVLLGSGFFSKPRQLQQTISDAPSDLNVRTIHSSQFRKLEDLFPDINTASGKKILMIGGGNSAGEAAAAVAQQLSDAWYSPLTGKKQYYKDVKVVHIASRPLYGLPPYNPIDNDDCKTYIPIDLKLYDLSRRPARPIVGNAGRVAQPIKDMIHNALQAQIGGNQADLGSAALAIPSAEPRSAVYVALSESYPEFVRQGLIEVLPGRVVSLQNATNGSVHATIHESDKVVQVSDIGAIIYATGYSPATAVDFLPENVKQALHYDPESLRLPLILEGWQTTASEVPDLALLGFYEGPYWPMIEMQARYTAQRWLGHVNISRRPFEEAEKLLDLRTAMKCRAQDVPQYWFGDYVGYIEELAAHLKLHRNDNAFAEREGPTSPARYLSPESDPLEARAVMNDLHEVWNACKDGRYVARAAFRALQGSWSMNRSIVSALPTFPSGTLEGTASFHPRTPTPDKSAKQFDLEYLYIESGVLTLSNGASMPTKRRYVYRYSEERDELSVWFVRPENDLEVDYLFHYLAFAHPEEARKEGCCIARADHLCVEDMYWTEYRLPLKGIALHEFEAEHTVRGPSKDYIATTKYTRPAKSPGTEQYCHVQFVDANGSIEGANEVDVRECIQG